MISVVRSRWKASVRNVGANLYYYAGLHKRHGRGKATILAYHRVLPPEERERQFVQPGMYVLDHVFDMQMAFIKRHFEVISLAELIERWKKQIWEEDRQYCVVTFDDGWLDNYRYAFPVLKRHEIPATIFLVSEYVGTSRWFWPDKLTYIIEQASGANGDWQKATSLLLESFEPTVDRNGTEDWSNAVDRLIEEKKLVRAEVIERHLEEVRCALNISMPDERVLLNWDEITDMSNHGISFGSHSCSHQILTTLSREEARREIEKSHAILGSRKINYVPVFCYPNGSHTAEIREMVRNAGYLGAVGGVGKEAAAPADLFRIRRIGIHNDVTMTEPLMALSLSGVGI